MVFLRRVGVLWFDRATEKQTPRMHIGELEVPRNHETVITAQRSIDCSRLDSFQICKVDARYTSASHPRSIAARVCDESSKLDAFTLNDPECRWLGTRRCYQRDALLHDLRGRAKRLESELRLRRHEHVHACVPDQH